MSSSSFSLMAISRLMIWRVMPWKIVVFVSSVSIRVRSSMSVIAKTAAL